MNFTKKIDRAFQWAGEKMGQEAKTSHSDEFIMLETEMALRHDGLDRLQKSMSVYVKAISRRGETFEDKEKGLPISYLGRTMISHGEDFETDSEFGNGLINMGRANERLASIQEHYVNDANACWLDSLERSLAMMKEYQAARKKLENRRLAYDAATTKMQKSKREDFRIEEELRTAKAKYEESSEDVLRRMQDIKEAEADSVRDLSGFLDAELDYHERCVEELRRVRQNWRPGSSNGYGAAPSRRPTGRSRSNTTQSYTERNDRLARVDSWGRQDTQRDIYEEDEPTPEPVRMPIRSTSRVSQSGTATPDLPARPHINRASTYGGGTFAGGASLSGNKSYREPPPPPPAVSSAANVGALRANLRPVNRPAAHNQREDVFGDDYDTGTSSGSPEYERSESPATSYGSLSRSASAVGIGKKAPPPPPPSRSKKPPPPIPAKREMGY